MSYSVGSCLLPLLCTFSLFAAEPNKLQFERDIRPILSDKCFQCHGPDAQNRQADLRLDLEEAAKEYAIIAGQPHESMVMQRIVSEDADELMPPPESKKELSESEIQLLQRWIAEGAEWQKHWAFDRIESPSFAQQAENTKDRLHQQVIDQYIRRELEIAGLEMNPPASKTALIRRATFDLTGLPPTLQEVDDFLADDSKDAYERVLDRLFASQKFGERMAVMWLDAARYGDTSVYHADGPRDMWGWRDTVVKAYNDNMPFDQFSIAQLAGDLLPEATLEEKVLAGFNRNNGTTDEGGAFAEEYRVEYAVDRVKTTSTVWLGLTMECAQCHDHKYDPISQEEYYKFYAYFNVSSDKGMQTRNGNASPTLAIPDPEKQKQLPAVEMSLNQFEAELAEHIQSQEAVFEAWVAKREAEQEKAPELPQGAILSVEFSEGKGRNVSAEPAISGKLSGKVQWVEAPQGKGLRFSGNNYVDFGSVADFSREQAFSYGGWIKPQKGIGALVAKMDDGNAFRGYDMLAGVGPISVHIINTWPTNAIKVTTTQSLKAGEWYHVFMTYDGSSKAEGIKVFVNGEKWDWKIEQDRLSDSIQTDKTLLVGSRHPGSRLNAEVDAVRVFDRQLSDIDVAALAHSNALEKILATPAAERTEQQVDALRQHFLESESETYRNLQAKIAEAKSRLEDLRKPLTTVMVMQDMEKPRDTFILNRGAYDSPTDQKVSAGTLAVLPEMPSEFPANRLGLAKWLFMDDQPLTSRVTVNRYWQLLFGKGLVATPEDFGSQGAFPSHPELLDWLAWDFRQNGWDIKRTLKQIMLSHTYRQSSRVNQGALDIDPENTLLASGPRVRLQAEFIRDTALQLAGLLDPKLGGPGVKPYQPQGLWVEVGLSGKPAFVQDHGQSLYRRSLYTYWKRSAPPPAMQIFDAPTREKCTIRRPRTNTPLQALVVLNDPQFVEASRKFAERIVESDESDVNRLIFAFRSATSRLPSESEIQTLLSVMKSSRAAFEGNPASADELLKVGEAPVSAKAPSSELAAWSVVASTILNLDETLTRE